MDNNRDFLDEIQDKIRKRSKGLYFNKKTYSYKKNLTIITLLILLLLFVLFVYYQFFPQKVENINFNKKNSVINQSSDFKKIEKISTNYIYYIKTPESLSSEDRTRLNQIFSSYSQKISDEDIIITVPKKDYSSIMKHILLLKLTVESVEVKEESENYFKIVLQKLN